MHAHFLDPYIDEQSPMHKLDGRVKLVLALVFILATSLTPPGAWPVYVLLLSLVLSAELLSHLGIPFYLKRSLLALPFVLAALPLVFTVRGTILAELPLGLAVTLPGVERFVSIAFKSWISVQAALVLASTTSFPDILLALRALRLPRLLVAIIGLMWRYLFVIVDEAMRLLRARSARSGIGASAAPGRKVGGTVAWRARIAGGMAGGLMLRSLERSDRIYNAMLSRGYDGEVRSMPHPALRGGDWLILVGFISLLVVFVMLGILGWG